MNGTGADGAYVMKLGPLARVTAEAVERGDYGGGLVRDTSPKKASPRPCVVCGRMISVPVIVDRRPPVWACALTCTKAASASQVKQREEWAVRWPGGEVEECPDLDRAQQILRLYVEPVLLRRVVTVGAWETATPPASDDGVSS